MRRSRSLALIPPALLVACSTTIVAPEDPEAPVSVFVIDYGRHSSLLLPGPTDGSMTEYAFGDWDWFALDESESFDVFPTLFWPTQGTLGRRVLRVEPEPFDVRRAIWCEGVLQVVVAEQDAADLSARLGARFEEHLDTLRYQPLHDLEFVHSDRSFHLFHNCNHTVAGWLRELGCQVRGAAIVADFGIQNPKPKRSNVTGVGRKD